MGDGANDENPILKTILEMVSSQHRISNQLQTIIERTDTMSEALDKIKAYAAQIDAATAYGQKNQPSRKSLCLQLLR
jgi:Mlc titration factor MtfA (ptsG expression regulator)